MDRHLKSIGIATVFAPLVVIPGSAIFILSTADYTRDITVLLETFLMLNIVGVPIAYIGVLFYGIPMHLIVSKFGLESYTIYALAGAIVPIPFLLLFLNGRGALDELLIAGSFMTGFSITVGLTFLPLKKILSYL